MLQQLLPQQSRHSSARLTLVAVTRSCCVTRAAVSVQLVMMPGHVAARALALLLGMIATMAAVEAVAAAALALLLGWQAEHARLHALRAHCCTSCHMAQLTGL